MMLSSKSKGMATRMLNVSFYRGYRILPLSSVMVFSINLPTFLEFQALDAHLRPSKVAGGVYDQCLCIKVLNDIPIMAPGNGGS